MASSALNAEHWLNKQRDNGTIAGFVTWRKWSHNSAHTGCGDVRGSFTVTLTNTGTQTEQLKPPFYTQRKLFLSLGRQYVYFSFCHGSSINDSQHEKKLTTCYSVSMLLPVLVNEFNSSVFLGKSLRALLKKRPISYHFWLIIQDLLYLFSLK